MQEKQQEIEKAKQQIEDTAGEIAELEETIRQETEQKDELSRQHKDFIDKREGLSDKINELDKECFRLNNQKEKMEERINSRTTYVGAVRADLSWGRGASDKHGAFYAADEARDQFLKI